MHCLQGGFVLDNLETVEGLGHALNSHGGNGNSPTSPTHQQMFDHLWLKMCAAWEGTLRIPCKSIPGHVHKSFQLGVRPGPVLLVFNQYATTAR